ncbi:MAG TPA: AAA family ATPase [Rickettsiales bacterium]|nr:AAA family ATPase [Rickettsiales bacterium]
MKTGPANNIIAIASGKGGVGKTWLAITLSQLIARTGRKVLLFDGDIGLANVDVQLGLMPQRDLSEVFFNGAKLVDVVTPHSPNFDIIAGRSGSGNLSVLPQEKLAMLKNEMLSLSGKYDFVFIDLGAGVEEHVRALAALASRCIVVVTDEPTSLTDAYAFIKLCTAGDTSPFIDVVVNQSPSLKEGEKTYASLHKACINFLKISPPCLGVIRKDGKVKDAIRHQQSLVARAPHCTAASDAAAITIKLMQRALV